MEADLRFVKETFTPAERAEMSGLSQMVRRRLEGQGQLLRPDGRNWAKMDLWGVAVDKVFAVLNARGLPPRVIRPISEDAAPFIVRHAFAQPGAVADPKGLNVFNEPVIQSSKQFASGRFMFIGAERTYGPDPDLSRLDGTNSDLSAAVVLDLVALAKELVARAPRPLATVEEDE
jgi:hypothetical protein